jgi:hypothetical protein
MFHGETTEMGIQRRVALIGSGQGPWISTQGLKEPRAKITGLKEGGEVCVQLCDDPAQERWHNKTFQANGVYGLHESQWMRVACANGGKSVICDILTKKAVV